MYNDADGNKEDGAEAETGEEAGAYDPTNKGGLGKKDSDHHEGGGRIKSGPLSPENGGTRDPEKDWEVVTGGQDRPGPKEGYRIGPRGEVYRPENKSGGVSIDIPAEGDRPRETLHYD